MKNIKSLLILLSAVTLCGCTHNNGECYEHKDADNDGICDVCKKVLEKRCQHVDQDPQDGICDLCGEKMPAPQPVPEPEPTEYTVYLVVGQYGRLNNQEGSKIDKMFLEYAFEFTDKPGAALPGKDKVSHVNSSEFEFDAWLCYENKGAPTIYSSVPKSKNKILYASFKKVGGQN